MALATRENSGLVVKIDRRGRMHLYVHGKRVPAFGITTEGDLGELGKTIVSIPTMAITFENVDSDPVKDDPLDAEQG